MAAVVAFILDKTFIETPMEIKVEGRVLFARAQGELAPKRPVTPWLNLIAAAGLTGNDFMEHMLCSPAGSVSY
jgi:hypothetical protein